MAQGKQIQHHGEAIVLRTWPFHEADLLLSLFTRDEGKVKGVARHAMRSRRRFGGALEPATHVRAHYTERPKQELVRLDSFEILWSPLSAPIDYLRTAGLQLVVEVLEEVMPDGAVDDHVFRLALTVLHGMSGSAHGNPEVATAAFERPLGVMPPDDGLGTIEARRASCAPRDMEPRGREARGVAVWLGVTYFCLWMNRLMGWMPELGHCAVCGLDLRGEPVWWSPAGDGVTCVDDRRPGSLALSAESVGESYRIARTSLPELRAEEWPRERSADLRAFALGTLERHMGRRLRSAVPLAR